MVERLEGRLEKLKNELLEIEREKELEAQKDKISKSEVQAKSKHMPRRRVFAGIAVVSGILATGYIGVRVAEQMKSPATAQEAAETTPKTTLDYLLAARDNIANQQYNNAVSNIDSALFTNPNARDIRFFKAQTLYAMGAKEQALLNLREVDDLYSEGKNTQAQIDSAATVQAWRGLTEGEQGNTQLGEQLLTNAKRMTTDAPYISAIECRAFLEWNQEQRAARCVENLMIRYSEYDATELISHFPSERQAELRAF